MKSTNQPPTHWPITLANDWSFRDKKSRKNRFNGLLLSAQWGLPATVTGPQHWMSLCAIWIPTVDLLKKNYYTKMCNPAQTQWCILVRSWVGVVFVIRALQACLDRWWKGVPCGPLPGLFLILHMCFRPPWQHAWAWHFGRGIYSEKSNPCPQSAPRICHHVWWLKITSMWWFCWWTSLLITDNLVSL